METHELNEGERYSQETSSWVPWFIKYTYQLQQQWGVGGNSARTRNYKQTRAKQFFLLSPFSAHFYIPHYYIKGLLL